MNVWKQAEIIEWYDNQPYLWGANFIPSTAVNQLEMWQQKSFDPETIQRELSYAHEIGMNFMRVYLHDLLWEQNREGFCSRIDQYLAIADALGIKTMFVLFDDCWNQQFALGPQPDPIPCRHNSGWVQSPGLRIVQDSDEWERLERYVKELLGCYKNDQRILVWDLYNEPGNDTITNDKSGTRSLPLLTEAFRWARDVDGLTQPMTSGVFEFGREFSRQNEFVLEHSDLITFHDYTGAPQLAKRIKELEGHGRPMVCTEYMARGMGSTFEHCLPLLKEHNVGAINWGLVSGRTQTIYPWEWNQEKGEPDILFHDVLNSDGTFLYPDEEQVIKRIMNA